MKRFGIIGALGRWTRRLPPSWSVVAGPVAAGLLAAGGLGAAAPAQAAPPRPDQTAFRAVFKELVETNTTLSAGSCTLAATRMAAHLA